MTFNHFASVLFALFLHGTLALVYFGWGKAFMSAAAPVCSDQERPHATFIIWVGWAFTLFVFQLIHFAFPLNFLSVSPIFCLGIVLSVFFLTRLYKRKTKTPRLKFPASHNAIALSVLSVLLFILSAWLVSRSMLPASNFDSGLYHFNAVRWRNSFPIIPGLGNLHGRLAFNQSFFSYVAALNLHPLFGHGRSIANSFLWLLSLFTLFEVMLPFFSTRRLASTLSPMQWATPLFCSPILAFWALSSNGIQSPSPDLTSSLLQIIMFILFCRVVDAFANDANVSQDDSIIILFLGATAITVKLSNLAFCGIVMLLTFILYVKTSEKRIVDSARLLLIPSLIIMVFCLRGIVLSGAPLYPSTIGYVNTEWSVPVDKVIEMQKTVYSWARQPNVHWSVVLGNWDWLAPWFQRVTGPRNITRVVYPAILFLTLSTFSVFAAVFLKPRPPKYLLMHWMLHLPFFAGIAFWFATAPDPRFLNAMFLLLPVLASLLFAVNVQQRVKYVTFTVIICALFIVCNFNLFFWAYRHKETFKDISLDGYQAVEQVPLNEMVTRTGLRVYTPVYGQQCWDSPLPCTPYFNEKLRLRKPNDMLSGFTVSVTGDDSENTNQAR